MTHDITPLAYVFLFGGAGMALIGAIWGLIRAFERSIPFGFFYLFVPIVPGVVLFFQDGSARRAVGLKLLGLGVAVSAIFVDEIQQRQAKEEKPLSKLEIEDREYIASLRNKDPLLTTEPAQPPRKKALPPGIAPGGTAGVAAPAASGVLAAGAPATGASTATPAVATSAAPVNSPTAATAKAPAAASAKPTAAKPVATALSPKEKSTSGKGKKRPETKVAER